MDISKQLIEIMDYLADKLGIAVDWSSQNIQPIINDLCSKYIAWEINTSVAWIAIAIVATIIGCIFGKIIGDAEGVFFVIVIVIIALGCIGFQIFDIIKCKTFPELQIYDYITNTIIPKLKWGIHYGIPKFCR